MATTLQGFSDDTGTADLQWRIPRKQAPGTYTATVTDVIKSGYIHVAGLGQDATEFAIQ